MRKLILGAIIVLLVQLGLIAFFMLSQTDRLAVVAEGAYLSFVADTVDTIRLADNEGHRVVLQRADEQWQLPERFAAKADGSRVTSLLAKLAELQRSFVVATSGEAAARFKVTADSFERHLELLHGNEAVVDLYVGTSPAFRQVHVRLANEQDIVTVSLPTFELEATSEAWLDKAQAAVKEEQLVAVKVNDLVLRKVDDKWLLGEGGESADQEKAKELVNKLTTLQVLDVLDPALVAPLFAGEAGDAAFVLTVEKSAGELVEYRFAKGDGDFYVLQLSGGDMYFKVHSLVVENLQKIDLASFVAPPDASGRVEAIAPIPTGEGAGQ